MAHCVRRADSARLALYASDHTHSIGDMMDYQRASEWANLQAHIETMAQTLFNVRDANLTNGKDITDAPAEVRMALDDLRHELDMWRGKLNTMVDMRHGPQDHACSGSWVFRGFNAGGHEVYACDSGLHSGIGKHVTCAYSHECSQDCTSVRVVISA